MRNGCEGASPKQVMMWCILAGLDKAESIKTVSLILDLPPFFTPERLEECYELSLKTIRDRSSLINN